MEKGEETIFHLQGRTGIPGALVGEVNADDSLIFLENDRYRLNESWWASGGYSSDRSVIEEVER